LFLLVWRVSLPDKRANGDFRHSIDGRQGNAIIIAEDEVQHCAPV